MIAAVLLFRFSNSHAVNQAHLQEIARSFQVLENETGYGGFIHNFKNSILRPEEPTYAERALVNYQAASAELIALQGFAQEAGVELDVASLQSTLDLYRDALDLARAAHLGGASVQEVDRLVRISDDEAHLNLLELRRRVELLLNDRLRTSQWRV
ncbi:hypothetical protein, partial [Tritonibacter horizontis]|uniref:hypothetical protein n=1 Tax=Tritonibacter horizontis TaxID=1768241 RepID=UPI001A95B8FE